MGDEWVRDAAAPGDDAFDALEGPMSAGEVRVVAGDQDTVVVLSGEIDLSLATELGQACQDAIASRLPIRVDLGAVSFIDSTALGFVASLAAAERDQGRRLTVTAANRRTAETFQLSGLGELLDPERDAG